MRPYIERGGAVRVGDRWFPVDGFALTHHPGGAVDGSVFTLTPNGGPFEPCLGYRIDYGDIEEVKEPATVCPPG